MTVPFPTPGDPPRPRCPRCGAALGALAAAPVSAAGEPDGWYCGCCGLVLPGAGAGGADAARGAPPR